MTLKMSMSTCHHVPILVKRLLINSLTLNPVLIPCRFISTSKLCYSRGLSGRRGSGQNGDGNDRQINFRPRRSKEDTRLTEVITIYEKLTKSRSEERDKEIFNIQKQLDEDYYPSHDVFRPSSYSDYQGNTPDSSTWTSGTDILKRYDPLASSPREFKQTSEPGISPPLEEQSAKVLDFSKFRNILRKNYSYFSAKTGLLQSHTLDSLGMGSQIDTPEENLVSPIKSHDLILNSKQFCLSIVNPTEKDLAFLGSQLHVHDLTLRDIREQNTEEKVEVFKNYTFLSLRPYLDGGNSGEENKGFVNTSTTNVDLNVILFTEFAIILHHGQHWNGFKDMLGFLYLLTSYGNSPLTPDWVLFSIFIELCQDAKYSVKSLEPKIIDLKVSDSMVDSANASDSDKLANTTELSSVLTKNFQNEFEIYKINRFIKPKIKVIKMLRSKCGSNRRVGNDVLDLLSGTRKELEEMGDALSNFSHILERSQDTCLTLANVRQSQEANEMGKSMKRISEVALLFLPLQCFAGFLGMNVRVPFQELESTAPFWTIILSSGVLLGVLYKVSRGGGTVNKIFKQRRM